MTDKSENEPRRSKIKATRVGPFPQANPPVFLASAIIIAAFIIFGAGFTDTAGQVFNAIRQGISTYAGWFYILVTTGTLVFVIWLGLGRYKHIRLSQPDSKPRFSYPAWFAMLFSAGMGIGLVFFGVAEPVLHYENPPVGEGGTTAAADTAMRWTYLHWGFHAWAVYIVVGLSLAYFAYRHELPMAVRSLFYPLIGDRIYGPIGHVIDVLAVFGTMFGVATSLGLGVLQINTGLSIVAGIEVSPIVQVLLIAGITAVATVSVVSGVSRGIRRLSELNLLLSALLLLFVFFLGPTLFIIWFLVKSVGGYMQNIVELAFWTDILTDQDWQADWTVFYWGWWISWSPFVGIFIARVSRGRTIGEFVAGVLVAPVLVTFVWFATLGGTGLYIELFGEGGLAELVAEDETLALFAMLDSLPWATLTSSIVILVVFTYFVTSSDSASLVIDMLTSGGNPDPPKSQRVFWAVSEGVVAAILLVAGGLEALQSASITAGLPVAVLLVLICWSLLRALRLECDYGVTNLKMSPEDARREAEARAGE